VSACRILPAVADRQQRGRIFAISARILPLEFARCDILGRLERPDEFHFFGTPGLMALRRLRENTGNKVTFMAGEIALSSFSRFIS
jgi:hypothetical protein